MLNVRPRDDRDPDPTVWMMTTDPDAWPIEGATNLDPARTGITDETVIPTPVRP